MELSERKTITPDQLKKSDKLSKVKNLLIITISLLIFIGLILIRLYFITTENYNLLHVPLELFAIAIELVVFAIAWNSRQFSRNDFFIFIGISFLFIGIIDLFHTLLYAGLLDIGSSNYATSFWIAARYLQTISFLISYFFINRQVNIKRTLILYSSISFLVIISILLGIFPTCWDNGLTPFKIISEYVIIVILSITIVLFYKERNRFENKMISRIIIAILFMIISEFAFTLYQEVTGIWNLTGHIFRIVSFYWIYNALVQITLNEPYQTLFRSLSESEMRFRRIFEENPIPLVEADFSGIKKYLDNLEQSGISDFRKFFESNPEEVIRCAGLIKTIDVNKAHLNLFKITREEVFREGIKSVLFEGSYRGFLEELIALAEGKLLFEIDTIRKSTDGSKKTVILSLSVVPNYEKTLSRVLISLQDITKLVEFEDLRRQFVDTVSHELRTPISVITQAITNLQKYHDNLSKAQEETIINSLSRNAKLLTELVEELLLISRIDHEKLQLDWKECNLLEIISNVLRQFNYQIEEKNLEIEVEIDESIELFGDYTRIFQIFTIFIDNAIKYSPESTKIEVKAIDHYQGDYNQSGRDGVLIQINDEGPGIPEKDIPHLFERFYRSDDVQNIPGTGLGLAIAHDLAVLHLGETFVESTYGQGSSFMLFLPRLSEPPSK